MIRRAALMASVAALAAVAAAAPIKLSMTQAPERAELDPLALARSLCAPGERGRAMAGKARLAPAARAFAQEPAPAGANEPPTLLAGLATERLPVTTTSRAAQAYFDQGVAWVFGFNHDEAVRAFRYAQQLDPACAMCFWGEAYALGPNINVPMFPDAVSDAVGAAKAALAVADGASDIERALIEAIQVRYAPDAPEDRSALDQAFAEAMIAVAERFPDDDGVQVLAAEAIMDTQPWDYWEADGITPKGESATAVELIERVLARNPEHAPAIHLYIHMTEATVDPWRAEPYLEHLETAAPSSGHLVHMPSHVYYRVGRYKDSMRANTAAVAADEAFLALAGEQAGPVYRYVYYPHNLHFLMTSAQMAGDAATVLDLAPKLDGALPMELASLAPPVEAIKAAPWLAYAQFEAPEDTLARPAPADAIPFVQAHWRYARGEALARLGRLEEARAEANQIAEIASDTDWSSQEAGGLLAAEVLAVAERLVRARADMAERDYDAAIVHLTEAVAAQGRIYYMEPPYWHYPVRQTLGAALLLDGQAARAEQEFFATLVASPDNAYAYWGLAQAQAAQGDRAAARASRRMWRERWAGGRAEPTLDRL